MGPRLGRVEYDSRVQYKVDVDRSFNGATLRTRGIPTPTPQTQWAERASMGPRLGRVEYFPDPWTVFLVGWLQWGHA